MNLLKIELFIENYPERNFSENDACYDASEL
jgi:hypothetical protein